ncbi:MAG: MerR family transcriptional regulator [Angelakisella sp.]
MNIKEVENLTGITSKNIRFYEEAGLLSPRRNEQNSYREYEVEDLRRVKLIKMLRKVDMPLGTIREVLDGAQPLDKAMSLQCKHLEQSIHQMEAAKQLCRALESESCDIAQLDVDGYLDKIDALENQGEWFVDIVNDFKEVVASIGKESFFFVPDELVTTPREFTDALLAYAKSAGQDITITKEGMYPEFRLEGLPYKAQRIHSRFGPVISAEIADKDLLATPNISVKRRRAMEIVWRYIGPTIFWVLFLFIILARLF